VNIREFILDLDLKDKWGVRRDCPACNGKNTLNINNVDGNILYNCYHLGCTVRGSIHQGLSAEEIHNRLHRPTLRKPDPERNPVPGRESSPLGFSVITRDHGPLWVPG